MDYFEGISRRGLLDPEGHEEPLQSMFRLAQRIGYNDFFQARNTIKTLKELHHHCADIMESPDYKLIPNENGSGDDLLNAMKKSLMLCGYLQAAQDWFSEIGESTDTVSRIGRMSDMWMDNGLHFFRQLRSHADNQSAGIM